MKNGKNSKNIILEDRGSTLITVIVAIGFVTILTTIILGASIANYRMKAIDRRAKDDFYYAEKALNDIYTGISQEVAERTANSYDYAFKKVGANVSEGGSVDIVTAQKAEKIYREKFFTDIKAWLDGLDKPSTFQTYIVSVADRPSFVTGVGEVLVEDVDQKKVTNTVNYSTTAVNVRIKDINVVTTDEHKDYKSEIITDIVISIPMPGFFENNLDVVDYALIGNEGIEVNGALTVIDGNVYAGLGTAPTPAPPSAPEDPDGGLKINEGTMKFDGNYLVSKGDITVGSFGKSASFEVGKNRLTLPNIWFDSLVTHKDAVAPAIDVKANTFALNDVELNAVKSNAKFTGSYYGYDDGTLTGGGANPMLIGKDKEHSDSSAIIINGSRSSLDMSGLSTLMLMGKAYIETSGGEIPTAEALALHTNQQLYLVPAEFLELPNPVAQNITNESDWGCNISPDWFGYKYLKIESGKPKIKTIKVGSGSDIVSYAFIEFDDLRKDYTLADGSSNNTARYAFIYEIMLGIDTPPSGGGEPVRPTQSQLRQRIHNSLANVDNFRLEECVVNNSPDSNVFSMNALANYVVDSSKYESPSISETNRIGRITITPVSNTADFERYLTYPQSFFRRFQFLCAMLDAKEDIPLSKTISSNPYGASRSLTMIDESAWKAGSEYPYKYYVYTPSPLSTVYADPSIPDSSFGKFFYTVGNHQINSDFKGVVIATGNITVASGVNINGTLIAKGKIIFSGNNVVKSDRALVQKRIAKETELLKNDGVYCYDYLISYLDNGTGSRMYGDILVENKSGKEVERRIDYTEYIYFENWKKGGRDS